MEKVRAGVNTTGVTEHLKSLTPIYGSALTSEFYADGYPSLPHWGRLSDAWAVQFNVDRRDVGIDYVIFSYGTPIAWHLLNGDWVKPNVKYSPTTSKHQSRCPSTSDSYQGPPSYVRSA